MCPADDAAAFLFGDAFVSINNPQPTDNDSSDTSSRAEEQDTPLLPQKSADHRLTTDTSSSDFNTARSEQPPLYVPHTLTPCRRRPADHNDDPDDELDDDPDDELDDDPDDELDDGSDDASDGESEAPGRPSIFNDPAFLRTERALRDEVSRSLEFESPSCKRANDEVMRDETRKIDTQKAEREATKIAANPTKPSEAPSTSTSGPTGGSRTSFPAGFAMSGFLRPLAAPPKESVLIPKLIESPARPAIKSVDLVNVDSTRAPYKIVDTGLDADTFGNTTIEVPLDEPAPVFPGLIRVGGDKVSVDEGKAVSPGRDSAARNGRRRREGSIPPKAAEIVAEEETLTLEDGSLFTLHPHQSVGIKWLLDVFRTEKGCLLADDMGLGKTVQVSVFLRKLFERKEIKRVLLLSPKSVLQQWEEHLQRLCPHVSVFLYHGASRKNKLRSLQFRSNKYILLTTYETFRSSEDDIRCVFKQECKVTKPWDVWVADEATAMKNHTTNLWRSAREIRANCTVFLTGTPIMNRYDELWALMELIQPRLLGQYADFSREYACLLSRNAWGTDERRNKLTRQLRDLVIPYILRRTKEDIFGQASSSSPESSELLDSSTLTESSNPSSPSRMTLPPKTEILVWQDLTDLQRELYMSIKAKMDICDRGKVLVNITQLKKLCRHPVLCLPPHLQTWRTLGNEKYAVKVEEEESDENFDFPTPRGVEPLTPMAGSTSRTARLCDEEGEILARVDQSSPESLRMACNKLQLLYEMLPRLSEADHITLIFSESTATLSLVEVSVLNQLNLEYRRIDGSLTLKQRELVLQEFREKEDIRLLLLSTGAGCLGLNLTRADRVILLDPSWNPAKDMQAIDRVYRIGQVRPVRIYRLIIGGAIEDNMIRLQLFKMNLSSSILLGAGQKMWFTIQELRDLFSLGECATSKTRRLLSHLTEREDILMSVVGQELQVPDSHDSEAILRLINAAGFASMDDVIKEIEDAKLRAKRRK